MTPSASSRRSRACVGDFDRPMAARQIGDADPPVPGQHPQNRPVEPVKIEMSFCMDFPCFQETNDCNCHISGKISSLAMIGYRYNHFRTGGAAMPYDSDIRRSHRPGHLCRRGRDAGPADHSPIWARGPRAHLPRGASWCATSAASPSPGLMEVFLAEYGLSTEEGIALMCLAEALLAGARRRNHRRADRGQDRALGLGQAHGPFHLAAGQRLDLGADADRQGAQGQEPGPVKACAGRSGGWASR